MTCERAFKRQLRERGFRLTAQREIILSVLHEIPGLATAEEIYQRVQAISSSVDISTVYRTLDLLQGFDLVSHVELDDGQRRYELLGLHGPHLHLVCQACGEVLGADLEVARLFAERLQAELGFHAALEHLSIPGLCASCAQSATQVTDQAQHDYVHHTHS